MAGNTRRQRRRLVLRARAKEASRVKRLLTNAELVNYLMKNGWQMGKEADVWMIANPNLGACRRKEDTIYMTLRQAAKLQSKWDYWEKEKVKDAEA